MEDKKLFQSLYEYFDNDTIKELLLLAIESINNNMKLVEESLVNKNSKELYRGCHNLKNISLLGKDNIIVKFGTDMSKLIKNKNYNEINIKLFNKSFKVLKENYNDFIKTVNNEINIL